jgi:hypothetical protein
MRWTLKVSEELKPMASWLIENHFITHGILSGDNQSDNDTFVLVALSDSTSITLDVVAMRIAMHRVDLPVQVFLEMNEGLIDRRQLDRLANRKAIKIENEILIRMSPLIKQYFLRLLAVFPYENDDYADKYKFFSARNEHKRLSLEYQRHGYTSEAEWHSAFGLPFLN